MSLDELIARLEAAEGYDPLLNVAIWRAVDPEAVDRMDRQLSQFGVDDYLLANNCEDFTGSLDAAMGLVPEGKNQEPFPGKMAWCVTHERENSDPKRKYFASVREFRTSFDEDHLAWAATPALALCIAALRARVQP